MKKATTLLLLALLCGAVYGQEPEFTQDFQILFESQPGRRMPTSFSGWMRPCLSSVTEAACAQKRTDFNGDEKPELVALSEGDDGNPEAFIAIDLAGAGKTAMWSISYDDLVEALDLGSDPTPLRFMGVIEYQNGDDFITRRAAFRSAGRLALFEIDGAGKQGVNAPAFTLPASQTAVVDLNDDGSPELVVRNRDTQTIQVWGRQETNTATEDEIEAALFRLFQNYPNPFQTSTTIAYDVAQPGPVTITVYDILGRRVRTLVEEAQPVGTYQVDWDGRDAVGQPVAAGTYFYHLRVGDAGTSKQAIRLK